MPDGAGVVTVLVKHAAWFWPLSKRLGTQFDRTDSQEQGAGLLALVSVYATALTSARRMFDSDGMLHAGELAMLRTYI
jgi:hypothetical protein